MQCVSCGYMAEEVMILMSTKDSVAAAKGPLFHVVLAREDEWPQVKSFASREELVAYLGRLKKHGPTRAYLFCGRRLFISKGPHRCLLDGDEAPLPLYETKVCRVADPDDYLEDASAEDLDPD